MKKQSKEEIDDLFRIQVEVDKTKVGTVKWGDTFKVVFAKCPCCKKDSRELKENSVKNPIADICEECKDEYIKRNVDEFKKYLAIRKIQLGK